LVKYWNLDNGQGRAKGSLVVDQVDPFLGIGAADLWRAVLSVFLMS
jgi:hypothetical protein